MFCFEQSEKGCFSVDKLGWKCYTNDSCTLNKTESEINFFSWSLRYLHPLKYDLRCFQVSRTQWKTQGVMCFLSFWTHSNTGCVRQFSQDGIERWLPVTFSLVQGVRRPGKPEYRKKQRIIREFNSKFWEQCKLVWLNSLWYFCCEHTRGKEEIAAILATNSGERNYDSFRMAFQQILYI